MTLKKKEPFLGKTIFSGAAPQQKGKKGATQQLRIGRSMSRPAKNKKEDGAWLPRAWIASMRIDADVRRGRPSKFFVHLW